MSTEREKTGVFTGSHAVNPVNGERIPIWIADYVLAGYGTGAIMAVPAHDERDFEFAQKFGLPIRRVIAGPEVSDAEVEKPLEAAYIAHGEDDRMVNSAEHSGKPAVKGFADIVAMLERQGQGKASINYRLRDWLISRQRYWGTPIPVVYCPQHEMVPVPDDQLPVVLPPDAPFTGEGGNPLEKVKSFVEARCPKCGGPARRETDTMDTFVDSSWYFYRYLTPTDERAPVDPEVVRYWFPIDLYVGGIEHAILHLVYSRFWTKVMRDLGLVDFDEPVTRLFPQGMVHKDGEVMSKSKGNTVAPDEVIARYGADTLRLYILFEGPPEMSLEWNEDRILGPHRFLQKVWRLVDRHAEALARGGAEGIPARLSEPGRALRRKTHQTILKVSEDVEERVRLNTAVAALMELLNAIQEAETAVVEGGERAVLREAIETLLALLNPYTPHLSEELWQRLGHADALVDRPWPVADAEVAREAEIELAVQVNGKVRTRITVPQGTDEASIRERAFQDPRVQEHVAGREVAKVVVVPGRLVSVVVR
jgi:leucyl-tRNA synthetase